MADNTKTVNVFRLLSLMIGGVTLPSIMFELKVKRSTAFNFIKELKELGFEVNLIDTKYTVNSFQVMKTIVEINDVLNSKNRLNDKK